MPKVRRQKIDKNIPKLNTLIFTIVTKYIELEQNHHRFADNKAK
jgi:hypothetical protein